MKKAKPISKISELILSLGISAGIMGMVGMLINKQMEMMGMIGNIDIKDVVAGMVFAYNELLEKKEEEIKRLKEEIKDKDEEAESLRRNIEKDVERINSLSEKLKEKKKEKRKTKKGDNNGGDELQDSETGLESAD